MTIAEDQTASPADVSAPAGRATRLKSLPKRRYIRAALCILGILIVPIVRAFGILTFDYFTSSRIPLFGDASLAIWKTWVYVVAIHAWISEPVTGGLRSVLRNPIPWALLQRGVAVVVFGVAAQRLPLCAQIAAAVATVLSVGALVFVLIARSPYAIEPRGLLQSRPGVGNMDGADVGPSRVVDVSFFDFQMRGIGD